MIRARTDIIDIRTGKQLGVRLVIAETAGRQREGI